MSDPNFRRTWWFEAMADDGDVLASCKLGDASEVARWVETLECGDQVVRVEMIKLSGSREIVWLRAGPKQR